MIELNDIYWQLNLETLKLTWSEGADEFFGIEGFEELDVAWDFWSQRIHPEDRAVFMVSAKEGMARPFVGWTASCRVLAADDTYVPIQVRSVAVMRGHGEPDRVFGVLVDLAERKRIEDQLRRAQSELVIKSGETAMGVMAVTLAHEINQPLAAVANYLGGVERLLKNDGTPDYELLMEAVRQAKTSLERSGAIVRQIRSAVEKQERAAGLVELRNVVKDAAAVVFTNGKAHGVEFSMDVPRNIVVHGDYEQLQQVIVRLLRNGVEAVRESERKELTISAAKSDGRVRIEIIDSGVGLPVDCSRIFDVFAAQDTSKGMGLSVTRTIVEAHEGRIWPEQATNGGSKFVVELPLAA